MRPLQGLRRKLPAGPVFLFPLLRQHVVRTVTDQELDHCIKVVLCQVAAIARQNELDTRAGVGAASGDPRPRTWQDTCDWLIGLSGLHSEMPEREDAADKAVFRQFADIVEAHRRTDQP